MSESERSKLHVWIVITYDPVPGVDVQARIYRYGTLALNLLNSGCRVSFWTSTFDHATKKNRFLNSISLDIKPGFTAHFLKGPAYARNISIDRIRHNRAVARAFAAQSEHVSKPDLIFAGLPCLEVAEAASAYGARQGVPVVLDVQDIWPDVYLRAVPRFFRRMLRLLLDREFKRAKRICKSARGITAVSESYLEWALRNAGRLRGSSDGVFPLGCTDVLGGSISDAEGVEKEFKSKHSLSSEKIYVIYLGQFAASYDLETVVDAAAILKVSGDHSINLILAGDGDKAETLKKRAQGLDNIIFTGWLDQRGIIGLLRSGAMGLAPYAADVTQSLPYKPFEYMSAALPIISSLRGELQQLIDRERIGLYYPAGNSLVLAEKIRCLAYDSKYRELLGKNARSLFKGRYDMGIIYPALVQHLTGIVKTTRHGPAASITDH